MTISTFRPGGTDWLKRTVSSAAVVSYAILASPNAISTDEALLTPEELQVPVSNQIHSWEASVVWSSFQTSSNLHRQISALEDFARKLHANIIDQDPQIDHLITEEFWNLI